MLCMIILAHLHVLLGALSMTNDCSFDIKFEKFNKNIHIEFPKGLNIIYGESGSGKSKIIYSILNKANPGSANFSILNKI